MLAERVSLPAGLQSSFWLLALQAAWKRGVLRLYLLSVFWQQVFDSAYQLVWQQLAFLQGIFRAKQPLHDCRMTVLAEFLRHGVFRLFPQPDGVSGCGMIPDSLLCILSVDDEKNQTFWER